MKSAIQFALVFAVGLSIGVLARSLISPNTNKQTNQPSENAYNENQIQKIMNNFQGDLNKLEAAKNAEDAEQLSKRVEAQLRILDINIKFRESQYAKVAPFIGLAGVLLGWVLGALAPRLLNKRSAGSQP